MQRTPPPTVRRLLREEVGFGCPVSGCGSPYLSWHHFASAWHERQHHDPNGVIALCKQHHDQADGGAFTTTQLQGLKAEPYLKVTRHRTVRGRFNWRRDRLVLRAGLGTFVGCTNLLEIGGRPVIWLSKDADGYETLNLDLFVSLGRILVSMRENDWVALAENEDIDCPAQGRSLRVKSEAHGAEIAIAFRNVGEGAFREMLRADLAKTHASNRRALGKQIAKARAKGDDWFASALEGSAERPPRDEHIERLSHDLFNGTDSTVTVCDLRAKLPWPIPVQVTASRIRLPGNNILSGMIVVNSVTAISLS